MAHPSASPGPRTLLVLGLALFLASTALANPVLLKDISPGDGSSGAPRSGEPDPEDAVIGSETFEPPPAVKGPMRRPEFIARQARCPSGLMGRLIGRIMSAEPARANQAVVELLDLAPTDHVLEVGFGHGRTIRRVASAVPRGFVAGVDLSDLMLGAVTRRNRDLVRKGLVELRTGDSAELPYPDASFDKVFAVHTLYFWSDPLAHLGEIRRVLKRRGRFVLGFTASDDGKAVESFPASVYRFYSGDEVRTLLGRAGFDSVGIETRRIGDRVLYCAIGRPGSAAVRWRDIPDE